MDHLNNQEDEPSAGDPTPCFEKQPNHQQPPPAYGPEIPVMPTQYQPYYTSGGTVPGEGPVVHPLLHTTHVVPVQPTNEPDYLGYSIFTMLCCCLPLGIAALVYSVKTRDANRMGNGAKAKQSSKMARKYAQAALGVGVALIIGNIARVVLQSRSYNP